MIELACAQIVMLLVCTAGVKSFRHPANHIAELR
jgi:hypothetical protein